eukprot:COSAG05_NODE_19762_length_288_cov_0.682540_1_plen_21_part_10
MLFVSDLAHIPLPDRLVEGRR